jgi:hypothetical protein
MYKQILTVLTLSLIAFSAMGQSAAPSPSPTVEQRVSDLEKKIQKLEGIPIIALALGAKTQPPPVEQSDAPLQLVRWWHSLSHGQYAWDIKHEFGYILKNRSNKQVKLVEGTLVFTDLLGERLMGIQLAKDVSYPAGVESSSSGLWDYDRFQPQEARLTTIRHDDVKATLTIEKVVYTDNSVWTADQG